MGDPQVLEPELIVMVPASISKQLSRLRLQERGLRLVWGVSRVLALAFVLLVAACFTDWLIDRWHDTPWSVRVLLVGVQLVAVAVAVFSLVLKPLLGRLPDDELALWVEQTQPAFGHRLISTVQLNRPNARLEGMSPELVAVVTRETEELARTADFGSAIDRRRAKWSLYAVAPVVLAAGGLILAFPDMVRELLAREMLLNVPITRSVTLDADRERVAAAGDPVELQLTATGPGWNEQMQGIVRVTPKDGDKDLPRVPKSSAGFEYRAWLADGRTHEPGTVRYEPRPALQALVAALVLPRYVGTRPDGSRYEELQDKGDITGWEDCEARVALKTSKPVVEAVLEVLGSDPQNETERVVQTFMVRPEPASDEIRFTFPLRQGETAYRIRLKDRHGFTNKEIPRRSIRVENDEPPRVALLPEYFYGDNPMGNLEDTEFDGIPVPLGEPIRIAYRCKSPLALDRAVLRYRVLRKGATVEPNNPPWESLPLVEVLGTEKAGPFDLARGCFEHSPLSAQISFHAIPSPAPQLVRGRLDGGGRFDWETRGLKELKEGDSVEFYIEVYDRKPGKAPGASEVRVKEVLDAKRVLAWVRQKRDETTRLRQLEQRQAGLFDPNATPPR
jgi:hypothetical protein